jgi:citrate lyase subunit beta / citryl-CoA lyase
MKPVRTALFAPGSNERVMGKAVSSGADAVIFDLEDSVPIASKADARGLVAKAIDAVASVSGKRPGVFVRVNATATGLLNHDLAAIVRPGLDVVFLPKAETVDEVKAIDATLKRLETAAGVTTPVEVVLMFESALGIYRCFELIQASKRVTGTCIGTARDGDLQADLGCSWSIEGMELMYARSKVLLDSRAAGAHIFPMDGVFADLNDEAGFIQDSTMSARLGYMGRTVIHPKQIEPARQAYAVPDSAVTYYEKVVSEFEAAEKKGIAAVAVDGKLVDYAMYQRARRVLVAAKIDR